MWSHLRRWKRCLRQSQKMRKVAAVNRYVSSMLACVLLMTDTELSVPPLLYLGVHQHLRRVGSINHYDRKNTTHRHSLFYKGQLILALCPILGQHKVQFKGQAYGQFHGVPYKTYCVYLYNELLCTRHWIGFFCLSDRVYCHQQMSLTQLFIHKMCLFFR